VDLAEEEAQFMEYLNMIVTVGNLKEQSARMDMNLTEWMTQLIVLDGK